MTDNMARAALYAYATVAFREEGVPTLVHNHVTQMLNDYRAEVLTAEAAELKAHCLEHNRFAATGFMDCPCRVADELLRRAKETRRGE